MRNSNQKPIGFAEEAIRAQLRQLNLTTEAAFKVIVAFAEEFGFTLKYDEKTGEFIELKRPQYEDTQSTQQEQKQTELDPKVLADALKSSIENAVSGAIRSNMGAMKASVDTSIHIENNKAVMNDLNDRFNHWFRNVRDSIADAVSKEVKESVDKYCRKCNLQNGVVPNSWLGTTGRALIPKFCKRLYDRCFEDMLSSIWKVAAYVICMCSLIFTGYMWFCNRRMENVVKEYGIIKPVLMENRYYAPVIHTLDSTLSVTDIDEVLDRIQRNQYK